MTPAANRRIAALETDVRRLQSYLFTAVAIAAAALCGLCALALSIALA